MVCTLCRGNYCGVLSYRYANSGSFQKAIEDFETALKLNPNHQNARKYMGETLVALGRR
jgi:tetratricopeptide (TPR) repeat protein